MIAGISKFFRGKKLHSIGIIAIIVIAYLYLDSQVSIEFIILLLYMILRDMAFRDALTTLEKRIK